jgi:secreted trypsin-like serine protease
MKIFSLFTVKKIYSTSKGGIMFNVKVLQAIICLLLLQLVSFSSSLNNNAESYIVGGRKVSNFHFNFIIIFSQIIFDFKAVEGQFPYFVSLRTIWNTHMCGGGILNSRWILSAAHCTVFLEIPNIVAGSTRLNGSGEVYHVEKIVNHQNYDFERDPFIDE